MPIGIPTTDLLGAWNSESASVWATAREGNSVAIEQKTIQPRTLIIDLQVSEVRDPIAKVEICFFVFKRMVFGQMPVSEDKVINFRVFLQGILCKDEQKLVVAMVDGVFVPRLPPAFPREVVCKPNAKVGMQPVKCPLRQRVAENFFQQFVFPVSRTQSVAVADVIGFSIELAHDRMVVNLRPELFGEIPLHPHVVIADKIMDFDTHIGQFAEFAEDAAIAFGNGLPVLKPEVKDIAHQIEFGDIRLDLFEPPHKMAFAHQARDRIRRAEMQIGCEIYFGPRIQAPRR